MLKGKFSEGLRYAQLKLHKENAKLKLIPNDICLELWMEFFKSIATQNITKKAETPM